jgi:hypothetical protein
MIVDAGPHLNPAKAADGKRLHKLDIDPVAVPSLARPALQGRARGRQCSPVLSSRCHWSWP